MKIDHLVVCALSVALAVGCNQDPKDNGHEATKAPEPLNERMGLTSAKPSTRLEIGEECTQFADNDACKSGLCLRTEPGFPPKGFCSNKCKPNALDDGCPDSPSRWQCSQLWPSADGWFCVPRKGWVSAKATHNGLAQPTSGQPSVIAPTIDGGTP
jgi:hypothetical protein